MIEVEMTKDIRNYEPKLFGVVTVRQIICLTIGVVLALPLIFFLPIEDITTKVMVAMIPLVPMIMFGWIKVYGMKLEKFLWQAIRSLVLTPSKRKYKTESTMDFLKEPEPENGKKKVKIIPSADYPARD